MFAFYLVWMFCHPTLTKMWLCLVENHTTPSTPECYNNFLSLCVLSRFSRVRLSVTQWTKARQAPLSTGFSRQESWSGLPCTPPGDLPDPRDCFLHWQTCSLPVVPAGKPLLSLVLDKSKMDGDSEVVWFCFLIGIEFKQQSREVGSRELAKELKRLGVHLSTSWGPGHYLGFMWCHVGTRMCTCATLSSSPDALWLLRDWAGVQTPPVKRLGSWFCVGSTE